MRIVIGSDHAGFPLKADVLAFIRSLGHEVADVGSHTPEPVDFPDIARAVCGRIREGMADRGLMVCGTGVGAANVRDVMRIEAIHAALAARGLALAEHPVGSAYISAEHLVRARGSSTASAWSV